MQSGLPDTLVTPEAKPDYAYLLNSNQGSQVPLAKRGWAAERSEWSEEHPLDALPFLSLAAC